MRSADYVVKRVLFAVGTVFVAVTLNFVLFRSLSGDAVSALRCRGCSLDFKNYQRKTLGLDKSKWEQYKIYLGDLAQGNMGRSLRTEEPVRSVLWEPIKNTVPMVALGTFFAIVFGVLTGVIAAWRRGTAADKTALWGAYGYTADKDVARVPMKLEKLPYAVDQLTWTFLDMTNTGGRLALMWGNTLASTASVAVAP